MDGFRNWAIGGLVVWAAVAGAQGKWVDESSLEVHAQAGGSQVQVNIANPESVAAEGELAMQINDLEGKERSTGSGKFSFVSGRRPYQLTLPGELKAEDIPLSVLKYQLRAGSHREEGQRSLMAVMGQIETRLVGQRDFYAGSQAAVRLVVLNHASGQPIERAQVIMTLEKGKDSQGLFKGTTDQLGTLDASFRIPEEAGGTPALLEQDRQPSQLVVKVDAPGYGTDEIRESVTVKRVSKILLTTDKPLYQPGQTMHLRALSLALPDLKPDAKQDLLLEVMDSKGNKVFKESPTTDEFGIAAKDFVLASEVNLGPYIVRATLGNSTVDKQVQVERYVLPKFKVELTPDKKYYLPGETIKGKLKADYFFGQSVANGKVELTADKFEVEFTQFAKSEGQLDAQGSWDFEIKLPEYFAGTPIEQGKTSVRLTAKVTDSAEHQEEKVVMVPIAKDDLQVYAIPEAGQLIKGFENKVYLLAATPDGSPAEGATFTASSTPETNLTIQQPTADSFGLTVATITPSAFPISLSVTAKDKQGHQVTKPFQFYETGQEVGLLLRTDQSLYQVGDTLKAVALVGKEKGTVYFDLIHEGQTIATRAADSASGRASTEFDLEASMSGTLVVNAYVFTPKTDVVRDSRIVYVNPATDLQLAVKNDKDTYRPGEEAKLLLKVTDRKGQPQAAAVGVSVVDESVYALQEIHPGLEKVYFTIEQEIMKPRYEIHAFDLGELVKLPGPPHPGPGPIPLWNANQQQAARAFLAAQETPPAPALNVNTFEKRQTDFQSKVQDVVVKDSQRIQSAYAAFHKDHPDVADNDAIAEMLRQKFLQPKEVLDPWGNKYKITIAGGWLQLQSAGPDEKLDTEDDVYSAGGRGVFDRWGMRRMFKGGAMPEMMADRAMMAGAVPAAPMMDMKAQAGVNAAAAGAGAGAPEPPRVRQFFPETLYFNPAVITDEKGEASLTIPMADSITTWRLTGLASSRAGALGSAASPIKVFQDFFIDLDLPVAMTQHDRISVPVALYNYLAEPQTVKLKFEEKPWFKLDGPAEQEVQLAANEVAVKYFPIEVTTFGTQQLKVWAYGQKYSDAIQKDIEVRPDGEEHNDSKSDRLTTNVDHTVKIPDNSVAGASKILVKVFPGIFSQIVDGLDSMLQMPSGCFEQTSSITYPDILIVSYLKATNQLKPETRMKAEGFINAGYQRLLSYEVQGGGYSWFGDAPANQVLTAWGLQEFYDMSQVSQVDPNVIERARAWLLNKQQEDGSWKPDASYLHQESWKNIQDSAALVTAYIADALYKTKTTDARLDKARQYLETHWKADDDPYALGLMANAAVGANPKGEWAKKVTSALYDQRKEDKDTVHWESKIGTMTFSRDESANIESTALAAIAFMRAGLYPETVTKALTYLVRAKSQSGNWGSTQATILALKALLLSLGDRTEKVNATITVSLDGKERSTLKVDEKNYDVMQLVDLGAVGNGEHKVALSLAGEGTMLYQVVTRYYQPWSERPKPQEALTITVDYDKTELAAKDLVRLTAKVKNNQPLAAQMVIIDLGIPPGFDVMTPDLEQLVKDKKIQKYNLTGRQVIIYLERIEAGADFSLSYQLQAKYPLRAKTPSSRAYEYYNPKVEGVAQPQEITVK